VRHHGGGVSLVTLADPSDGGEHPTAEVGEALPAGKHHLRRPLHPLAVERRPPAADLVVGEALELAEVDLT
jgi:hypothetical protein